MSLDISLRVEKDVFDYNITHNLSRMALECMLYYPIWRPEEIEIETAKELIPFLEKGLILLKTKRQELVDLEPCNGWGKYQSLVDLVVLYIEACKNNPESKVKVWR